MIGDFIDGVASIPKAARMILGDARLRKLAMLPLAINIGVVLVGVPLAFWFSSDLFEWIFPASDRWAAALRTLAVVLFTIALVVSSTFLLVLIGRVLGAPAHSALSEAVEEWMLDEKHVEQGGAFLRNVRDAGRSIATALGRLGVFLLIYPFIFATQFIPVAGAVVFPVLATLYGAFVFSFDFTEPAWERHLPGFRNRLNYLRRHTPRYLGFGLATVAMMLIPFVNMVIIPVCIAAATRLYISKRNEEPITN